MWFTFIGSWFSFLVQCYCLTVYHDLQLPRRLEIILRIRTGPTGRFSYGSGSTWAASCPFGCGCGCQCSICLYPSNSVRARGYRRTADEVEDRISESLRTPRSGSGCPRGQASSAGCGEESLARPGRFGRRAKVQRVSDGDAQIEKLGVVKSSSDSTDSGDDSEPDNPDAPDAAYEQLEARILQGAAQNTDTGQEDDDVDSDPLVQRPRQLLPILCSSSLILLTHTLQVPLYRCTGKVRKSGTRATSPR